MKKLMIAAAASTMLGAVFATDCGDGCNINIKVTPQEEETIVIPGCQVTAYSVKFSLKSLAAKGVKTGDCQGYCMEQGNRTLDGLLWSCCTQCENWDPATAGAEEVFQYCLWEKNTKIVFTDGLLHQNGGTTVTTNFVSTYSANMKTYTGTFAKNSGFIYETKDDASIALQKAKDQGKTWGDTDIAFATTENKKWGYKYAEIWAKLGNPSVTNIVDSGFEYDSKAQAEDAAKDALKVLKEGYQVYTVDAEGVATTVPATPSNTVSKQADTKLYAWYCWAQQLAISGEGANDEAAKNKAIASVKYMTVDEIKAFNKAAGTTLSDAELDIAYLNEKYGKKANGSSSETSIAAWADTAANIAVYRFSRNANKAEALWLIDTENECGHDGAIAGDYANVALTAAGFGSTKFDKKTGEYVVSSLSGNCAGTIEPVSLTEDCDGNVCDMCVEFTSWCTDGIASVQANTFASGTWTMKYLSKLTFTSYVPTWAIDYASSAQ